MHSLAEAIQRANAQHLTATASMAEAEDRIAAYLHRYDSRQSLVAMREGWVSTIVCATVSPQKLLSFVLLAGYHKDVTHSCSTSADGQPRVALCVGVSLRNESCHWSSPSLHGLYSAQSITTSSTLLMYCNLRYMDMVLVMNTDPYMIGCSDDLLEPCQPSDSVQDTCVIVCINVSSLTVLGNLC